jgi:hypothetical protein
VSADEVAREFRSGIGVWGYLDGWELPHTREEHPIMLARFFYE